MLVDLVRTTTRDDVRLDGVFQAGSPSAAGTTGIDAFCLVHGTGSNFYGSTLLEMLAGRLQALGCGVLRANTRGHDGISTAVTSRGGRRLGAAYEVVDDCRHDLAAWIEWLRQQVGPRVGLVGHSLGAVKCLYAAVHDTRCRAEAVVSLSPPRLSYATFCESPQSAEFLATFRKAQEKVQAGQPGELLEVPLPLPFLITAAGFVEKYGPDERYNFLHFLRGYPDPALLTFGSREVESNMAFRGVPEDLATQHPQVQTAVIDGADHFYTDRREELATRVETWLRAGFSPIGQTSNLMR